MGEAHYVTQEGLDKLREELAEMIAERPVISRAIAEARDKGDLSENAEYDAAREAQGMLELKISKMQDLIANAKVIDESKINTETVQMLTKVKLKNLGNGATEHHGGEAGDDHPDRQGPDGPPQGRGRGSQGPVRRHQV